MNYLIQESYLAKVSIELAVASNDMNVVMRRLAALSAIFLPLTLISGISLLPLSHCLLIVFLQV